MVSRKIMIRKAGGGHGIVIVDKEAEKDQNQGPAMAFTNLHFVNLFGMLKLLLNVS